MQQKFLRGKPLWLQGIYKKHYSLSCHLSTWKRKLLSVYAGKLSQMAKSCKSFPLKYFSTYGSYQYYTIQENHYYYKELLPYHVTVTIHICMVHIHLYFLKFIFKILHSIQKSRYSFGNIWSNFSVFQLWKLHSWFFVLIILMIIKLQLML